MTKLSNKQRMILALVVMLMAFGLMANTCDLNDDGIDLPDNSTTCVVNGQTDPMCQSAAEEALQQAKDAAQQALQDAAQQAVQGAEDAADQGEDILDQEVCDSWIDCDTGD